jgi:hypothetical protein
MKGSELLRERLHTQHVSGAPLERPEDVVRLLGAVQSQDYPGAKWSLGQRLKNGKDADVERAFAGGKFLRTHVLRPTWHFVMPEDIRWMLQLTAPHVLALSAYQFRKAELDDKVFARCHAVFTRALENGNHRTRTELESALEGAGIQAEKHRLAYIMMHAELKGLVCSGAPRGKYQTYALLEERVPKTKALAREEALAELTRRFFVGHAPATLKHFVWWSGLSMAQARAGLAMVRDQLACRVLDGTEWFGSSTPSRGNAKTPAHLIPEYDEALVGSKDMSVPDLPRAKRRSAWTDSFIRPIIIEGRRAGTWRRTVGKDEVVLEANLFAALSSVQSKALRAAAERYGKFLEMHVILEM